MKKKLSPPFNAEDDLVLEIVVFLGTCLTDASAAQVLHDLVMVKLTLFKMNLSAQFICKTGLLDCLIDLLKAKQEDDEMVLQVVYVFHQLCLHNEVRKFIIQDTDAVAYLVCHFFMISDTIYKSMSFNIHTNSVKQSKTFIYELD